MSMHVFGDVDGVPVVEVTIASKAGAVAKILSWGAVLRDLVVPTSKGPQRVTLGLNSLPDYQAHSPSFGAVPGRFANRIANGSFTLDGTVLFSRSQARRKTYAARRPAGFGKRFWQLSAHDSSSVTLTLHSPDGDGGFPGDLDRDLRLSHARACDFARRTLRGLRPADDHQSDPARLFQSRRLVRHPRP